MPSSKVGRPSYRCSFCGKSQDQVKRLIAGPEQTYICNECVHLCLQILNDEPLGGPAVGRGTAALPERRSSIKAFPPQEIHRRLNDYVVGQERAKKVLSVAVYNHYKRIVSSQEKATGEVELQKTNILLVGPTGSGKTLLAQTLARILDVPFTIADATSLTEAGYVGEDVENILLRLIQAADYDIARAERGVVYIDEIDKIGRKSANPSITRDVSGEGVQQGLLRIIEGCVANVPPQGGRKHPHQEFIQINTSHILFICGGAFEGLEEIVRRRVVKDRQSMGFGAKGAFKSATVGEVMRHLGSDDLLQFGLIPEFIGRMPMVVVLEELDKAALIKVLTEPKNALVKQYRHLFALDGVALEFTEDALDAAAEEALRHKTGARGLRTIVEGTLLDAMYAIPSLTGVTRCVINADVIRRKSPPLLFNEAGSPVVLPQEERSA